MEIPIQQFHASESVYKGADSFLSYCSSKNIPLSKVKNDLNHYQSLLDAQLLALIKKDYNEFVDLSASVLGMDVMISSVKGTLVKVRGELMFVRESVENRVSIIEEKQAMIRSAEEEKRQLQSFISIYQSLNDIEALLRISDDQNALNIELLRNGALIDRVVMQFTEMNFHASKSSQSTFVRSLKPRIERLESLIDKGLKELFLEAISPEKKDSELLQRCMRTYKAINRANVPGDIFRSVIVGPRVREIATLKALEGGRRTSCAGLGKIFDHLVAFALESVVPVMSEELTQAAFDEILEHMSSKFASMIFSTGIPEEFHTNLVLSQRFVRRWENEVLSSSKDERALTKFRKSASLVKWNKGWKIEVYFTLKAQEIIRKTEAVLNELTENSADDSFVLTAMSALFALVKGVWREDSFIEGLEVSFLRFTCQMLSRLRLWMLCGLDDDTRQALPESPWNSAPIAKWISGYSDVQSFRKKLEVELLEEIEKRLHNIPDCVTNTLMLAAAELEDLLLPRISEHIVSKVSEDCIQVMQYVRRINSMCFRPDSVVPETHMPEVESVMAPLKKAFAKGSPELVQGWKEAIGKKLLDTYQELTQEVLVQAQATQKFISQRSKTESAVTGMFKISKQFQLDIVRLKELFAENGMDQETVFAALQETVEKLSKGEKPE